MEYELGIKNVLPDQLSMLQKILYKADSCDKWVEYELDYILFAIVPDLEYTVNDNEVKST